MDYWKGNRCHGNTGFLCKTIMISDCYIHTMACFLLSGRYLQLVHL